MDKTAFRRVLERGLIAARFLARLWNRILGHPGRRKSRLWLAGAAGSAVVMLLIGLTLFMSEEDSSRIVTKSEGADPPANLPSPADSPRADVTPPAEVAESFIRDCVPGDLSAVLTLNKTAYEVDEDIVMTLTTTNVSGQSCKVRYERSGHYVGGTVAPPHHFFYMSYGVPNAGPPGYSRTLIQDFRGCDRDQLDFSEGEELWKPGHQDIKTVIWDMRPGSPCRPRYPSGHWARATFVLLPEGRFLAAAESVDFVVNDPTEPSPGPSVTPSPTPSPQPSPDSSQSPSPRPSPTNNED
jgi:hypothetical protein